MEKKIYNIAIIGHENAGKTTLMEAMAKCKQQRSSKKEDNPNTVNVYEINDVKQFANLFDPKDEWQDSIMKLSEEIEYYDISNEKITYPYTKEKYSHELNKLTNQKLALTFKQYKNNLDKKRRPYGTKN